MDTREQPAPQDSVAVNVDATERLERAKKFQTLNVHSFDLRTLTLSFKNASFAVGDRVLLQPISGLYRGGQLVAFMGPSGCGKTTLLTMVAHKKTTKYKGEFLLNGNPVDSRLFPRFTGYDPQDEHLIGAMTVRECIYLYVMLKNHGMSEGEGLERVEMLLEQLQLGNCADSMIGSEYRRGISGGQKRRVNIARAFANVPPIIFLDEPTSGLSAADSATVIECLRSFATLHNTLIFCVIHQPRHSVFRMFDELLLLSSEGRGVYQGPVNDAVDYFERMGSPVPKYENPADHFLDVVTTTHDKPNPAETTMAMYYESTCKPAVEEQIDRIGPGPTLEQILHVKEHKAFEREDFNTSVTFQTKLLTRYQINLKLRNWPNLLRKVAMYVVIGILFGLVFYRASDKQKLSFNRVLGVWVVLGFAAIFTMESLPQVMADRVVYKYDRMDGVYSTIPYLLSLSFAFFAESVPPTLFLGVIAYWMMGVSDNAGDFFFFLLFLVLVYWVTEGVMLLLASACTDAAQANGLTVAVVGVLLVFSGLVVNPGSSPVWLSWLCWLSPYWYAFQSVMVMLFRGYTFEGDDVYSSTDQILDTYGVVVSLHWWNVLIIIVWALLYRFLVVVLLRFAHNPSI